ASCPLPANIGTADPQPPTASITSPASATTYPSAQTVTITAAASDDVAVARVEFYDGATLKSSATAVPYTFAWTFTGADNGAHSWTAKAYDASAEGPPAGDDVRTGTAATQSQTDAVTSPAA